MLYNVVFILCFLTVRSSNEGDACSEGDVTGICKILNECQPALEDIKNRKHPQICSFKGINPVVCCVDSLGSSQFGGDKKKHGCEPIPPSLTAKKTGQKARDKCIEYQEQLVYPCGKSTVLGERIVRQNFCHHNTEEPIFGDTHVRRHEYPHMALLGYGNDTKRLQWLCAGAVISNRFILTAAHCSQSREYGPVTYVALNTINRADIDPKNIHKVKTNIKHPEFKLSRIYHDIGLLELETLITLDSFTVPACLNTGEPIRSIAVSTSWNTHDVLGTNSKELQKISLMKFTEAECSKFFPKTRRGGFNESIHLCYGDRSQTKDVCQDDGGSPVVEKNKDIHCMYTIVGITSLGKGCLTHHPGLYTKMDLYVPWIESIVWP